MKKMPILITVPLIAVLLIVGAAIAIKVSTPTPKVEVLKPAEFPSTVENETVTKPSTFLGGLFGQKGASTPTPTPATAADLSKELKSTYDDGGQAELDALSKDAASL